jgi:outer membrane protein assembly factor BamB
VEASPVIAGDKVVIPSGDGRVYMLDFKNGSKQWSYDVGSAIYSTPAVVKGMIVVGAQDGRIYAFGPR